MYVSLDNYENMIQDTNPLLVLDISNEVP